MIVFFKILAVILIGVAAFFLWRQYQEGVFVSGVLAACAYLLSVRFHIKARIEERKAKERSEEDLSE